MKTVGIFEAKTHLSVLCDEVERTGISTLIQRRGKPLVLVTPVPKELIQQRANICQAIDDWEKAHPEDSSEKDFPEVWKARKNRGSHPLDER